MSNQDEGFVIFWAPPPENVSFGQFNEDGTPIVWKNTSKTTKVFFKAHAEGPTERRKCGARGTFFIELLAGEQPFRNKSTMQSGPKDEGGTGRRSIFDLKSDLLNLAPNTSYRWQAIVVLDYLWDEGNCKSEGTVNDSGWTLGAGTPVPHYFSFKTP